MRTTRNRRPVNRQQELCAALTELIDLQPRANSTAIDIVQVAGVSQEIYHLLLTSAYIGDASRVLAQVLDRPFSNDHSGWLIDGREARTVIEAAHRALGKKPRHAAARKRW